MNSIRDYIGTNNKGKRYTSYGNKPVLMKCREIAKNRKEVKIHQLGRESKRKLHFLSTLAT